jgi:hypothetical protein
MVGRDEGWRVIRGIVVPPALPCVIRPFAADAAKHIVPENEGTDPLRTGVGEAIVSPVVFPQHGSEGPVG